MGKITNKIEGKASQNAALATKIKNSNTHEIAPARHPHGRDWPAAILRIASLKLASRSAPPA